MTAFLNLVICFTWTYHTHSQAIGTSVTQIKYGTGPNYYGDAETALTLRLHWKGLKFTWISNPSATNTIYEETSPAQTADSVNPSISYYFDIEWDGPPLQVTYLQVTDNSGSFYTIDNFCIAPKMQHTLDREESITPDSMSPCNQWSSKDSYDHIQLGTGTKYTKLYVDIPIFGSRFANKVVEGGVRPPNLLSVGFRTGSGAISSGKTVGISVQWDVAIYRCDDIEPFTSATPYTCSVSAVFCPGLTSDFWLSIHSPLTGADILPVEEITFTDETGTEYIFTHFCREEGTQTGSNCPDTSFGSIYKEITDVYVGGLTWPQLVPFLVPDSVFDSPDVTPNPEYVAVLEGNSPTVFGWDLQEYGSADLTCPETPVPSTDPTISPTSDPTIDPTSDPTREPTPAPTEDPTSAPTPAPTDQPTTDPTNDPTEDPTVDPTIDPTQDPTIDPTFGPTYPPTFDPTTDPTVDPTVDPTADPTIDPTSDPTSDPTADPTEDPTVDPTVDPTADPTVDPTADPTLDPTLDPTSDPTTDPTNDPTQLPTTASPTWTYSPTTYPTFDPTTEPTIFIPVLINNAIHPTGSPLAQGPTIAAASDISNADAQSQKTIMARYLWVFVPALGVVGCALAILCLSMLYKFVDKLKKSQNVLEHRNDADNPLSTLGGEHPPPPPPPPPPPVYKGDFVAQPQKKRNSNRVELTSVSGKSKGRRKQNNAANTRDDVQNDLNDLNDLNNAFQFVVEAKGDEEVFVSSMIDAAKGGEEVFVSSMINAAKGKALHYKPSADHVRFVVEAEEDEEMIQGNVFNHKQPTTADASFLVEAEEDEEMIQGNVFNNKQPTIADAMFFVEEGDEEMDTGK